jgi:nuclear transport factor 2 (NTF2) superfamily protein
MGKVRLAEDAWNTRDPAKVALGYKIDSRWRNLWKLFRDQAERYSGISAETWQSNGRDMITRGGARSGRLASCRRVDRAAKSAAAL